MDKGLARRLGELGFPQAFVAEGSSSFAHLAPGEGRCGIYVLHFADGEAYVGQARDVARRFSKHNRDYDDIRHISFRTVPRQDLDDVEKELIYALEAEGHLLRNRVHVSTPIGPSRFDKIMAAADQERWLTDPSFIDSHGPRPDSEGLRRRYRQKFELFRQLARKEEVEETLRDYVRQTIPAFRRSEMIFWICSAVPENSSARTVYARIDVYGPVAFSAQYLKTNEELYYSWLVARSPLREALGLLWKFRLMLKYRGLRLYHPEYRDAGNDQVELSTVGTVQTRRALVDPLLVRASRQLNMGLVRKGRCRISHLHCPQLADVLLD